MRIAVASSNGTDISAHFGRSACFLIFEIEGGKPVLRERRDNSFSPHARGECAGEQHSHHHGQVHGDGHRPLVSALEDCQTVICHGMGWRAAEDLKSGGITPVVLAAEMRPEEAVSAFLKGDLPASAGYCRCHE